MDNPRLELNQQRYGKLHSYSSIEEDKHAVFQEDRTRSRTQSTIQLFVSSLLFAFVVLFGVHSFATNDLFQTDSVVNHETFMDLIKDLPSSHSIHSFFEHYASYASLAGTTEDRNLATWTRDQFLDFGLTNATIEPYYPFLNYPVHRELAIVSGPQELLYQAHLDTAFHAYSASGNVTGPVVYVNYGRLEDFTLLLSKNSVSLNGTIALIRHGEIPASVKVQHAEAFGCIGVLMYTDPAEINRKKQKNKFGPSYVKRDSVQYEFLYPGDPFTPGVGVVNATRDGTFNSSNLPSIPSLPIAWSHALPLLRATQGLGVVVDPTWIGGLTEVSYYSGPSVALVNLVNLNSFEVKPVWNVLARIEGNEEKEKAIIIGSHRDAWDNGSVDPSSGASVMLEVARVLGLLVQNGWKPRRTIVFASWDANEYGNIGSTEYVEAHLPWLDKHAITYLNIDHAVTGSHFTAQGSPLLRRVLYEVTSSVINPRTSQSVYETWLEQSKKKHFTVKEIDFTPPLLPVGTTPGLDTTAFFQHAGISSLSMAFTNGDYGVSRSTFDSVSWMEEYGDPTFEYHQTMVRLWGLLAYRLSSELILPMNPIDYALVMKQYVVELNSTHLLFSQVDLKSLSSALDHLYKTSVKFDDKAKGLRDHDFQLAKKNKHKKFIKQVNRANDRLIQFERTFVKEDGLLLARPWYKHAIYGPSAKTGLVEAFPSLLETNGTEPKLVRIIKNAQSMLAKGKYHVAADINIVF